MVSAQNSLFILGLVLVVGTQLGSALKCHVCNSGEQYDGDACWDIAAGSFQVDCSDLNDKHGTNYTYTMCRKIYQSVEGDKRIIRDCAVKGQDKCVQRTGTRYIRMTYCECEGSLCNSASSLYSPVMACVALLTGVLAHFFNRS